jgi:hypothetical protein
MEKETLPAPDVFVWMWDRRRMKKQGIPQIPTRGRGHTDRTGDQ